MENGKEVSERKDLPPPALLSSFEQRSGEGFEQADAESYAIPFLQILQSGSPQCKRSEGAYIEGASEGLLYDTVRRSLMDPWKNPVPFVPVYFRRAYVEWQTREKGGGYVAEHPVGTPLTTQVKRDDNGRDILPNGNQFVDTRYHYGLLLGEDGIPRPFVITMSSTQIKRSKRWMSLMQDFKLPRKDGKGVFTPPSYARVYLLSTEAESNDKGSWYSWLINVGAPVADAAIVEAARAFLEAIKGGKAKEATDSLDPTPGASGDDSGAKF